MHPVPPCYSVSYRRDVRWEKFTWLSASAVTTLACVHSLDIIAYYKGPLDAKVHGWSGVVCCINHRCGPHACTHARTHTHTCHTLSLFYPDAHNKMQCLLSQMVSHAILQQGGGRLLCANRHRQSWGTSCVQGKWVFLSLFFSHHIPRDEWIGLLIKGLQD